MFQPFQRLFSKLVSKSKSSSAKAHSQHRYVLVLSGGGARGFYTLWVLKALEEAGLKDQIDAVYGISIGAMCACYRAAGWTAQEIFERFYSFKIQPKDWLKILPTKSVFKTAVLQNFFKEDLPQTFEELKIKTYVWATDLYSAELVMFHKGQIVEPLMGSIAIPGLFPNVVYQQYLLNDGGVVDNFPSGIAKKRYPKHRIIGVVLDTFEKKQTPKNLIETLALSFEILMRKDTIKKAQTLDLVFNDAIECSAFDITKKKRKKIFEQGYRCGVKKLKLGTT